METVKKFVSAVADEMNAFAERIDEKAVYDAAALINGARERGGRLHFTGIGKPSHVALYAASLFSSTGTPAYFLDGTEAVHGSCGQLCEGDVVVCISNSGETAELKATVTAVKNNGCRVIAVTGKPESWLAKESEICLYAGVSHEGGPLDRAPRASVLAEALVLQCLSVVLQESVGLTPAQYVKRHPGGALGKLRENEKQ